MKKMCLRLLCTLFMTYFYCLLWIVLEKLITGQIKDSLVDNVVMILFVPVIWLATSPICDWLVARKERCRRKGSV